jgi:hypothetical protein
VEKPAILIIGPDSNLPPKSEVKSLLFSNVDFVFSDRLLKWSKKNGFTLRFRLQEVLFD